MTCRELERLAAAGAGAEELRAHRASCAACERVGADIEETESLTSALRAPAWSPALRQALLTIPKRTVSCEQAASLIAAAVEPEPALAPSDRSRLEFHLSRCEGCREAFDTLAGVRDLLEPKPAAWVSARLTASRPAKRRSLWRGLLDPRTAIGFAYGSAVIVMLAGFNPADLARKAGTNLKAETRTAATAASGSLADRVGELEDRAARTLAIWKGRAGGYGRAVLSNAMSLVMKSEEPKRPPSRPRNGEERSGPRTETVIAMWRAPRT